jgi:hypothetical protein
MITQSKDAEDKIKELKQEGEKIMEDFHSKMNEIESEIKNLKEKIDEKKAEEKLEEINS